MKTKLKNGHLSGKKIALTAIAVLLLKTAQAGSNWGQKVTGAAANGANEIKGIIGGITQLLMAISAVVFLIGIVNAGYKYKMGDQQAFKAIQNVLIGSLVVLLGVGLAQVLFF